MRAYLTNRIETLKADHSRIKNLPEEAALAEYHSAQAAAIWDRITELEEVLKVMDENYPVYDLFVGDYIRCKNTLIMSHGGVEAIDGEWYQIRSVLKGTFSFLDESGHRHDITIPDDIWFDRSIALKKKP